MAKLILGNWKLNNTVLDTKVFIENFKTQMDKIEKNKKVKIGLAVPYTCLPIAKFKYAYTLAQNVSEFDKGAYTSQISVDMIKQFKNVKGSLVGHSECRSLLNESDAQINKKVLNLLAKDMQTIFCIGETKEIYEKGQTIDVIKSQIQQGLQGVTENNLRNLVVAYEPIWAIGTGLTATDEVVDKVCGEIHNILADLFGKAQGKKIAVVYGGSVKSESSGKLLALSNVDGVLVGGGSLKPEEFVKIIDSAPKF